MKIMICIPSMDSVPVQFCQSLVCLEKIGNCQISFITNSLIYDARNRLTKQAVLFGADYLFWLDSDMVFDPQILKRLIEADKDIISGLYFKRCPPYTPVIYKTLREREDKSTILETYEDYPENSIFEVEGAGFGCMLIKGEVMADIAAQQGDWFTPREHMGEDLAFCYRARLSGYHIFCDSAVKLGHVGSLIYTEDFFKARRTNK